MPHPFDPKRACCLYLSDAPIHDMSKVKPERCPRCHNSTPPDTGCALCNPERLGERLRETLTLLNTANERVLHEMARASEAETRATKLEAFKTFVHGHLDKAGIPADPKPEENAQHGCRIEGRLEWLFEQRDELKQLVLDQEHFTARLIREAEVAETQLAEAKAISRVLALEEAARLVESGSFLHDQAPTKLFANEVAPKIRALKEKPRS